MEAMEATLTQTEANKPQNFQINIALNFDAEGGAPIGEPVRWSGDDPEEAALYSAILDAALIPDSTPESGTEAKTQQSKRLEIVIPDDVVLSTLMKSKRTNSIADEQQIQDAQELVANGRHWRPTPRQIALGRVGTGFGVAGLGLGLAACDPVTECALNGTTAARECWDANTGVLRADGVRERWTEEEIVSGQASAQITRIDGNVTLYDNAVLKDVWVENGCVSVRGKNVLIQNALIRSNHMCGGGVNGNEVGAIISTGGTEGEPGPSPVNVVIIDTEINGMNAGVDAAVAQMHWYGYNLNIHGTVKGVRIDEGVTLEESYIHDLQFLEEIHGEGIYWNGGFGPNTIRHNWVEATQSTGAMAILNTVWPSGNGVIEYNYFGGNGGASFRGGAHVEGGAPYATNLKVRNNAIDTNGSDPDARAFCNTCPGNEWTGNYYVTGATVGGEVPVPSPG